MPGKGLRHSLKPALLASLAALALAAGCGEEETPESGAQRAVEAFFAGIAGEDFESACAVVVPELLDALGGDDCAEGLGVVASGIEPEYAITDVRVSGTKAAVDVELTGESGEVREDTIELVEDEGSWLISSFGS
jgi:hypothetical protein